HKMARTVDDICNAIAESMASMSLRENRDPLHKELIAYATTSCRMFYIQDMSAWQDWSTEIESIKDLSASEVCQIFLKDVLPKVYTYVLSEKMKSRVKLLDLHPIFKRVAQGYQFTPDCGLFARFRLQSSKDYRRVIQLAQKTRSLERSNTILIDNESLMYKKYVGYKSPVSKETATLLSVMLSTNHELSIGQMHNMAEIHKRLRRAKKSFEDTGSIAPFRSPPHHLMYRIQTFYKIRKNLCQVMNNSRKF
ncbi:hypothetical protein KR009_009510, partial [Drosophila setifemur]